MSISKQKSLGFSDERVKFLSEMLNGIRIVKYYAWEMPLKNKLTSFRQKELSYLLSVFNKKACLLTFEGYVVMLYYV